MQPQWPTFNFCLCSRGQLSEMSHTVILSYSYGLLWTFEFSYFIWKFIRYQFTGRLLTVPYGMYCINERHVIFIQNNTLDNMTFFLIFFFFFMCIACNSEFINTGNSIKSRPKKHSMSKTSYLIYWGFFFLSLYSVEL